MKLECKTWEKTSFQAKREHVVHNDERLQGIYRGIVESKTFQDIDELGRYFLVRFSSMTIMFRRTKYDCYRALEEIKRAALKDARNLKWYTKR